MIAARFALALPLPLPPLLPMPLSPATSQATQPVALDDAFAALVASAAPLTPATLPLPTGGRGTTFPPAPRPPVDDVPVMPEPIITAELLPLPPVVFNPVFVAQLRETVVAESPVRSPASSRMPQTPPRVAVPLDRDGPVPSAPRAEAPATATVLPIVATAVTLVSSSASAPSTPTPAPETSVLDRHVELVAGNSALDAITQDIVASAASTGRARFAVTPDTLGRVEIDMAQSASGITVHFATSSRTATDALVTAQPILTESAGAHGIRLAEVQVSTGGAGSDRQPGGHRSRDQIPSQIEAALSPAHPTSPAPRRSRHAGRFA